jgi:hypothetical protein
VNKINKGKKYSSFIILHYFALFYFMMMMMMMIMIIIKFAWTTKQKTAEAAEIAAVAEAETIIMQMRTYYNKLWNYLA